VRPRSACNAGSAAQVRGRGYLTDRKKVAAGPPMFALAAVDHVELDAPTFHLARCLPSLRCALEKYTCMEKHDHNPLPALAAGRARGANCAGPRHGL